MRFFYEKIHIKFAHRKFHVPSTLNKHEEREVMSMAGDSRHVTLEAFAFRSKRNGSTADTYIRIRSIIVFSRPCSLADTNLSAKCLANIQ